MWDLKMWIEECGIELMCTKKIGNTLKKTKTFKFSILSTGHSPPSDVQ